MSEPVIHTKPGQLAGVMYDAELAQRIVDAAEAATFSKTLTEPFIVWLTTHNGISAEAKLVGVWHLAAAGERGHTLSHRQAAQRLRMPYNTVRRLTYECVSAGIIERVVPAGGRALTIPGVWAREMLQMSADPAHATGRGVPTPRAGSVGSRSSPTHSPKPPTPERPEKTPLPLPPTATATAASRRRFDKSDFMPSDTDCPKCGQDTVLINVITSELNPLCSGCYRTEKANGSVDAWRRDKRPAPPDPKQNPNVTETPHGLVFDAFAHER